MTTRRRLLLAGLFVPSGALAQPRRPVPQGLALLASRSVMAGSALSVSLQGSPVGARIAIARPGDPATTAIVVVEPQGGQAVLPAPGLAGRYELRVATGRREAPEIVLRQPLETTDARATLAAPERVRRGMSFPVRGIGPNGLQDRVVLVLPDAPDNATGPLFFPAENVEAMLEAPERAGAYELRYVMDAPVSGLRVLARKPVTID